MEEARKEMSKTKTSAGKFNVARHKLKKDVPRGSTCGKVHKILTHLEMEWVEEGWKDTVSSRHIQT